MKDFRLLFGLVIAVSLLGQHMHDHGFLQLLDALQRSDEPRQIMPVNRAKVAKSQRIEEALPLFVHKDGFHQILQPGHQARHGLADQRNRAQAAAHSAFCVIPIPGNAQVGQVTAEGPHVASDGHLIVVENDDHPGF